MRYDRCNDAPQMKIYSKINFHKVVNETILIRCANTISARAHIENIICNSNKKRSGKANDANGAQSTCGKGQPNRN